MEGMGKRRKLENRTGFHTLAQVAEMLLEEEEKRERIMRTNLGYMFPYPLNGTKRGFAFSDFPKGRRTDRKAKPNKFWQFQKNHVLVNETREASVFSHGYEKGEQSERIPIGQCNQSVESKKPWTKMILLPQAASRKRLRDEDKSDMSTPSKKANQLEKRALGGSQSTMAFLFQKLIQQVQLQPPTFFTLVCIFGLSRASFRSVYGGFRAQRFRKFG